MTFFIDNNLSPALAAGMQAFGEDVTHLRDQFPQDMPDIDWLQAIGKRGWVLISRDERIRRNPAERQAVREYSIGMFLLGGKKLDRCRIIQQLVRNWPRIKDFAAKTRRPFIFRIPPTGTKITAVPFS
jgi:hypothetical protein